MRILGLDIGTKTIGVAVSDPMGWTAQGLTTIQRKGSEADWGEIRKWIGEFGVGEIVVGLPLQMDGSEGSQVAMVREFARELEGRISLPIRFWDERLSTAQAERGLLEADLSRQKRRGVINKMAAVVILQGYLEAQREKGGV